MFYFYISVSHSRCFSLIILLVFELFSEHFTHTGSSGSMRNRGWGEKGAHIFLEENVFPEKELFSKTIGGHWCLGKEDLQKRSRWTLLDSDGLRNLRRFLGDGPVRESWHGIEIG